MKGQLAARVVVPMLSAGVIEDVISACLELVFGSRICGRKCVLTVWACGGRGGGGGGVVVGGGGEKQKAKTSDDNWRFGWNSRM